VQFAGAFCRKTAGNAQYNLLELSAEKPQEMSQQFINFSF